MSWPVAAIIITVLLCITFLISMFLWTMRAVNKDIDGRLEYLENVTARHGR